MGRNEGYTNTDVFHTAADQTPRRVTGKTHHFPMAMALMKNGAMR